MTPEALKQIMLEKSLTDSVERAGFIYGFRTAEKIYTQEANMELKVKKLHPDAKLPTYGSKGAACFDIYALGCASCFPSSEGLPTEFFEGFTVSTGLAFEIPEGYAMKVYSRSGHGFKSDTSLANSVGIIDSDYTGQLYVRLYNHGAEPFVVNKGDRIAQAMLVPVNQVSLTEVQELKETERGANGFGSTGK